MSVQRFPYLLAAHTAEQIAVDGLVRQRIQHGKQLAHISRIARIKFQMQCRHERTDLLHIAFEHREIRVAQTRENDGYGLICRLHTLFLAFGQRNITGFLDHLQNAAAHILAHARPVVDGLVHCTARYARQLCDFCCCQLHKSTLI